MQKECIIRCFSRSVTIEFCNCQPVSTFASAPFDENVHTHLEATCSQTTNTAHDQALARLINVSLAYTHTRAPTDGIRHSADQLICLLVPWVHLVIPQVMSVSRQPLNSGELHISRSPCGTLPQKTFMGETRNTYIM